ncbi:uncharacterized protein DUF3574 [Neobacillus bataviensis]|uniref:Uncharacterized protein DUF3574 n=1 Tax=Neobacillus bataviensis TaxID=220685 RepID=A0A561DRI5_9BACI|nr:DUF3574 domain-containing protein [Neobacillus bataviensis]TWE05994.1 uncharacterized protein DUF3574 [Neobacillus bataviensis]
MVKNKKIFSLFAFVVVVAFVYISPIGNPLVPKPKVIEAQSPSNALEGEFHLDNVVKIYIPSTNGNEHITKEEHDSWVDKSMTKFSKMFGGATAVDGKGAWVDDNDNLIKEDVTIVYSFAQKLNNSSIDQVVQYAKEVKETLHQSSVSVEVNGKMYFVE